MKNYRLAKAVDDYCYKHDITMYKFGIIADVHKTGLYSYMQDDSKLPNLKTAFKIARVLNLSVEELWG